MTGKHFPLRNKRDKDKVVAEFRKFVDALHGDGVKWVTLYGNCYPPTNAAGLEVIEGRQGELMPPTTSHRREWGKWPEPV